MRIPPFIEAGSFLVGTPLSGPEHSPDSTETASPVVERIERQARIHCQRGSCEDTADCFPLPLRFLRLASQPTLSRFENQINIASLKRLREVLVDQFLASFAQPPLSLTFDLDAVDDPTHGSQQLSLFHGFYEQYQYLPLVITCAENDQIVMISLRHGTAAASLAADDDLEYLVTRVFVVRHGD